MYLEKKLRNAFTHEAIFQELKHSTPRNDVDMAFKTIYPHTFFLSGAGKTFKRFYKKANIPPLRTEDFLLVKKGLLRIWISDLLGSDITNMMFCYTWIHHI